MWLYLLEIEYKKIIHNKLLTILLFFNYIGVVLLLIFSRSLLEKIDIILKSNLSLFDYFRFPVVLGTTAWLVSYFSIFLAVFFLVFLMKDFSNFHSYNYKVLKKHLRGKVLLAVDLIIDWIFLSLLGALLIGLHYKYNSAVTFFPSQLVALPVQLIFYFAFAFFIFSLSNSVGEALLFYFGYFIAEALVRNILFSLNLSIGHYFPVKIATRLVEPPSVPFMSIPQLREYLSNNPLPFTLNILLALVYSAIFIILAYKILKIKTSKN